MRTKKATERTEIEEKRSSNWKRKFTIQFLHRSQENIPKTARTQDKRQPFLRENKAISGRTFYIKILIILISTCCYL